MKRKSCWHPISARPVLASPYWITISASLPINQTLAEMNGIPAEEHLGRGLREVLGEFAEVIEPQIKRALETRQPVLNFEVSSLPPAGSEPGQWIGHYIPISDATGEVERVAAIVVEVTEQKKLEESLQGVSDRLREEKKRLQVMVEVSRVLAEKLDVGQVFPQISANLRRILRQEYAALALHDEQSGQIGPAGDGFSSTEGAALHRS